ncbi:MAG: hypothetical protein RQ735_09840 [Flavobacteriaceae bacterium]|nr:hypothetical protein [Flavobacteriaceae bacterium]
MKTKNLILFACALLVSLVGFGQSAECPTDLSIMNEAAKVKNYDSAYEPFMRVWKNCPDYHVATYIRGEQILEHKIETTSGAEKTQFVNDLLKLLDDRLQYFPDKQGKVLSDKALLMMEQKVGSKEDVYNVFDKAFTTDIDNFTNPRGLYAYFSLLVDLYNEGKADVRDVFKKYDDVKAKIETESNKLSAVLNELLPKQEAGTLSPKEERSLKIADVNLGSFGTVSESIDAKLGILADCDNLIPLYNKDFEERKTDADWLNRAASRMSAKECTEDPLFFKLVEAYHAIEPSANSAFYLGNLAETGKDYDKAIEYYNQSAELQADNFKKADIYYRIARMQEKRGQVSSARTYANKALEFNRSMGRAYLLIANMYASSANNCGETVFEKRAVYWKSAELARRAGEVDATIRSSAQKFVDNFMAKAPSKADIFQSGKAGQVIQFPCWIGGSVKVPNL